ncbi:hypothetical protein ACFL4B_01465, partial [Candidatus Neomarinimicrobiota bacterium]
IDYNKLRDSKYPNLFKVISVVHLPKNDKKEDAVVDTSSHHYSKEIEKIYNQSDIHMVKTFKNIPKPRAFADFYIRSKEFVDKYYPNYDKKSNQNKNYSIDSDDWLLVIFLDMNKFLYDITPSPLESHIENLLKLINVEKLKIDTDSTEGTKVNQIQGNLLRWDGAKWFIRFNGIEKFVDNTKGMHIIAHLIRFQGTSIRSDELYDVLFANIINKDKIYSDMFESDLMDDENLSIKTDDTKKIKYVTKESITIINNERIKKEDELKKAYIVGDTPLINKLEWELKELQKWLGKNTNIEGKPRKIPDRLEKARKALLAAVTTAKNNIKKYHSDIFFNHLNDYLETGEYPRYHPNTPVEWEVIK